MYTQHSFLTHVIHRERLFLSISLLLQSFRAAAPEEEQHRLGGLQGQNSLFVYCTLCLDSLEGGLLALVHFPCIAVVFPHLRLHCNADAMPPATTCMCPDLILMTNRLQRDHTRSGAKGRKLQRKKPHMQNPFAKNSSSLGCEGCCAQVQELNPGTRDALSHLQPHYKIHCSGTAPPEQNNPLQ